MGKKTNSINGFAYLTFLAVLAVALAAVLPLSACGQLTVEAKANGSPMLTSSPIATASGALQPSISFPPLSAVKSDQSPSSPLPTIPSSAPSVSTRPEKPDKAVVLFTFDDGDVSDYLLAYPILKQYGIKGTSYIIAGFIDKGVPEKMTWAQVKEMNKYGWDFGDHTYTHEPMKGMTDAQIKETEEEVNKSFQRQGFQPPQVMAYPYGSFSSRVIDDIKPFRKQARLAFYETEFVDLKHIDPFRIPSVSADMKSEKGLKNVERIVDTACREKALIVIRVHAIYKDKIYDTVCNHPGLRSGSGPQTDSKLFAELVQHCVDKDCEFMTMTELMSLYSH